MDNIKFFDKELNSFMEVYEDSALKTAIRLEKEQLSGDIRGPLHGIPIGLKDIFDVKNKIQNIPSNLHEQKKNLNQNIKMRSFYLEWVISMKHFWKMLKLQLKYWALF